MDRTENRRRYFRIADRVDLTYRVINEEDVAESSHITSHILSACSLTTALENVTEESAKLLHRIEKKQPEMVHYLKLLDEKIDLLAQAVIGDNETDTNNSCEINLSASGLAFQSKESVKVGEFLELKMLLSSFRVLLVTCCKVIHCAKDQSTDERTYYLISADFVNLTEQDRDLLIQHLVRRQMQQIREKRAKQ